jgi:hypothetical protein
MHALKLCPFQKFRISGNTGSSFLCTVLIVAKKQLLPLDGKNLCCSPQAPSFPTTLVPTSKDIGVKTT